MDLPKFSKILLQNLRHLLGSHGPDILMLVATFWGMKYLLESFMSPRTNSIHIKKTLQDISRRQNKTKKINLDTWEGFVASDIIQPEQISLSFEDIGGLEDVKQKIQESVIIQIKYPELFERSSLLSSPKGILLYGPPGTGKTMIAKAIAKTTESVFINVNLATIFQKWLGESEKVVTAIFSLAEKMEPSIIFCDEVDSWLGTRSDRDNEVTARVKALFMSLWDGISTNPKSKVTIVAATNRPGSLDQAILRRLPLAFLIGLPDTQQRKQILSIILKDESISEDVSIEQLAQCTEGYSGSDLRALCQTAARAPIKEYLKNKPNDLNSPKLRSLLKQDFMEAMDLVQPTGQSAINYQQHQNSNSNRPVTINVNFMPIIPNNNGN